MTLSVRLHDIHSYIIQPQRPATAAGMSVELNFPFVIPPQISTVIPNEIENEPRRDDQEDETGTQREHAPSKSDRLGLSLFLALLRSEERDAYQGGARQQGGDDLNEQIAPTPRALVLERGVTEKRDQQGE
jgi:hypothetical protein